jgi:hypothetical protein
MGSKQIALFYICFTYRQILNPHRESMGGETQGQRALWGIWAGAAR